MGGVRNEVLLLRHFMDLYIYLIFYQKAKSEKIHTTLDSIRLQWEIIQGNLLKQKLSILGTKSRVNAQGWHLPSQM